MARILIAGCGDVGSRLALKLLSVNHDVWAIRRNVAALPKGVHPIAADLGVMDELCNLPEGLDYVFYTASAGGRTPERYQQAYADGPRNLRQALLDSGQFPKRWFFTSSTAVYGQVDGSEVNETSDAIAEGFGPENLRRGEAVFHSASWPGTVVRLAGIYGPGRDYYIRAIANGAAASLSPGDYTNRIHVEDCAGLLAHLINLPEPEPLYIGVDSASAQRYEVLNWIADHMGKEPVFPADTELQPGGKRCINQRLEASGFVLRYPDYRSGYGEMISNLESGQE